MPINSDSDQKQAPYDPYLSDFKAACILVDKVYFQCQQRECIENIKVRLPKVCISNFEFLDMTFDPGEIVRGTLRVTEIQNRPNFRRARFEVRITFTVRIRNTTTGAIENISGELPAIKKDIVLYMPEARDEFTFNIVVETLSKYLGEAILDGDKLIFTVGVFIITKVVGKVQLLIPEYGFCPPPDECEEFQVDEVCNEFEIEDFPDFFPDQLEDI